MQKPPLGRLVVACLHRADTLYGFKGPHNLGFDGLIIIVLSRLITSPATTDGGIPIHSA